MRAVWFVIGALVVVFVGVPFGTLALLHVKREDWYVKVRRLLGGLFVAIVIAAAMTQTAQAFKMECVEWVFWICY